MKICPQCLMGNSDETVMCRDCGASLGSIPSQDEETLFNTEMDKYECRQIRRRTLALLGVILSGVLNVIFFIIYIMRGTFILTSISFLFMPVLGYLAIFRPEALFRYEHKHNFMNIEDVKPTEWYCFKNMIGGIFLLVLSTVMMGFIAFH